MPFQTCNPYYLRISETDVLPLYVYLDERHIDFMSDRVLQHVLADLRPLVLPKLRAEADVHLGPGGPANSKKGSVDVHRGDTYQFCFFFRKTEPHTVLIKTRTFVAAPQVVQAPPASLPSKTRGGKRKGRPRQDSTQETLHGRKKRRLKTARKGGDSDLDLMSDDGSEDYADGSVERQSPNPERPATSGHEDADGAARTTANAFSTNVTNELPSVIDLEVEEEELKVKPILKLGFKGFRIHGRSLCVVVEPWPPGRIAATAPPVAQPKPPLGSHTITPPHDMPTGIQKSGRHEQTPLFHPGPNNALPLSQRLSVSSLDGPEIYNISDDDSDSDNGGMMLLSQVLNATGEFRAGADDDDGMDGNVFFGDADEGRE